MSGPQPRTVETSSPQTDACNYIRQYLDDEIAGLTSAVWSVCIECVCCHSVCVCGWNCVFVPLCVFGHSQLLCSRQHRVTSGLIGLSRELEEKTLPSGESQPQQIQAVLAVSSDIWPDSAPTTLAHKAAPHRPRFEIFLLWWVQKNSLWFHIVPYGVLLSGGKRSWNSYHTSQGPISNLLPSNNPVQSCSQERRESLELEPWKEAERIQLYHVKTWGGRLLEKAIKSPSTEQY